jgi:hypothetical protein
MLFDSSMMLVEVTAAGVNGGAAILSRMHAGFLSSKGCQMLSKTKLRFVAIAVIANGVVAFNLLTPTTALATSCADKCVTINCTTFSHTMMNNICTTFAPPGCTLKLAFCDLIGDCGDPGIKCEYN